MLQGNIVPFTADDSNDTPIMQIVQLSGTVRIEALVEHGLPADFSESVFWGVSLADIGWNISRSTQFLHKTVRRAISGSLANIEGA